MREEALHSTMTTEAIVILRIVKMCIVDRVHVSLGANTPLSLAGKSGSNGGLLNFGPESIERSG